MKGYGRMLFLLVLFIAIAGIVCVMHNANVPIFGVVP